MQEMAPMIHSKMYRFPYTRTGGMHSTYDVTINLVCRDSGVFAYEAWVAMAAGSREMALYFH